MAQCHGGELILPVRNVVRGDIYEKLLQLPLCNVAISAVVDVRLQGHLRVLCPAIFPIYDANQTIGETWERLTVRKGDQDQRDKRRWLLVARIQDLLELALHAGE